VSRFVRSKLRVYNTHLSQS